MKIKIYTTNKIKERNYARIISRFCFMSTLAIMTTACMTNKTSHKSTVSPSKNTPVTALYSQPEGEEIKKQLSTCLYESQQLVKINADKYTSQVNNLYIHIHQAQYYAEVAENISSSSSDTLTPLYQFRVNDACNMISQLLLSELKNMKLPGRQ